MAGKDADQVPPNKNHFKKAFISFKVDMTLHRPSLRSFMVGMVSHHSFESAK